MQPLARDQLAQTKPRSRPAWRAWLGLLLVLAPVVAYFHLVATVSVEVPYIDDYDAVVDYLTRTLDEPASLGPRRFFSRHNEHFMTTLRAAVLLSYAALQRIDFRVLNLTGSAFLVVLLVVLFAAFRAGTRPAEKLLAFAPAALFLVQPQYWMVLLSATTSLSGFAVTAYAALAFLALERRSPGALGAAVVCAGAATFALGSGALVLPLGALQLALARRWRALAVWCALAIPLLLAAFLLDPQERTALYSLDRPDRMLLYALNFVGGTAGFSHRGLSLVAGGLLLASFGALCLRRLHQRSPVVFALLLFVLGSIAANALLRTHHGVGAPLLQPRYRFYGSLLLALTYLGWLETLDRPRLARRFATAALPVALAFSLLSFALYRGAAIDFSERLERGFEYWWTTGDGGLSHPEFPKASIILLAALDAGHLRPPPGWAERLGSDPLPVTPPPAGRSVALGVDAVAQDDQVLLLSGWADVADGARGQEVEVVLNSRTGQFVFPTYRVFRIELPQPLARAGFRAVIRKRALPPGRYRVGALVRWRGSVYLTYLKRTIEVEPGRSRPRTTGERG
ncbi:MAG: hypothetical protein JRS35_21990 [Deltaproteobacteria bacterium]|nr:hypothetical protein [Deltaproteobacteria bacterium]